MGPRAVVVKGGHAAFSPGTDVLYHDGSVVDLQAAHVAEGKSIHGTGCTFSAAIAARLALGEEVATAVANAKEYTTRVIANAPPLGHGHPPGNHFYFVDPDDFLE
jgi:hydroxymethylpyrimidine/phosphomethylpyrimidine kinase